MDTDQLIQKMISEGTKKPLPHPMRQTMLWLIGTLLYLSILGVHNGLRADIDVKLYDPFYLCEIVFLFGIGISSALAAFCLSRPDAHQKPWIKYVAFALILPWIISAFAGASGEITLANLFHSMTLGQFDCPWHIALFSVPPGIAIFLIVRMGATIQCCWAGSMATLSVTAFGYMLMRLIEQNDNPAHLIVWHALPIMLMCMAGMMIGKFALKWR